MLRASTHAKPGTSIPSREHIEKLVVARLAAQAGRDANELHDELRSAGESMPVHPAEIESILPAVPTHFRVQVNPVDVPAALYYVTELTRIIHRELVRGPRVQAVRKSGKRPREERPLR